MDSKRFLALVEEFTTKRVTVLGDFILDEYLIGDTKRVSREAPVVVIDYRESRYHPGGAANAVQNVSALGAEARAVGVIGVDQHGDVLARLLEAKGAHVSELIRSGDIHTAVKTRVVAGELHAQRQQVARIDRSYRITPDAPVLAGVGSRVPGAIHDADAVLISDYGLGVVSAALGQQAIDAARERSIPAIVDSRFQLLAFRNATVATPNEVELFDAMKLRDSERGHLKELAPKVVRDQHFGGLIVTRGSRGMHVFGADGASTPIGIIGSRDVTDVTGAGDTVAATIALSLACGASLQEAAEMATYAASIVVMKRGTATVARDDLRRLRERHAYPSAPDDTGTES
jgi:rfaE bifunctional protein kinase chain/domain